MTMNNSRLLPVVIGAAISVGLAGAAVVPAQADYLRPFDNTLAAATTIALGQQVALGGPQPSAADTYDVHNQHFKFTVPQTSTLSVALSAPAANAFGKENHMEVRVLQPDGQDRIENTTGTSSFEVSSDTTPSKTAEFKVLAGTYYLRAYDNDSANGYGLATLTATPVADDPGGEPNDTQIQAKPVSLNTAYTGTINYYGKVNQDGTYTEDWYDFYSFTVPANNFGIELTFSRTNDGTTKNIQAALRKDNGGTVGQTISLANTAASTLVYNIEAAGTYYLYVNSWGASYGDATEYGFTLKGIAPTTIGLPPSATVAVKKTVRLTATVNPPGPAVTWVSSNTAIATVSADGVVTGVKKGSATITARVVGVSDAVAAT
jgi:hypothetical protein